MLAWREAFRAGWSSAARHWRVALPLYLCSLVLGLAQTWPLLAASANGALFNPLLGEVARGGGDELVLLLLSSPTAAGSTALWLLAFLPLTALFSMAYNFYSGGILSVYAGTRPFREGCRRTFWMFTGMGLILVVLAIFSVSAAATVGQSLGGVGGLIVALVLTQVVNLLGEYGRAIAAVRDERNPLVLLGAALRFCLRHPGGVLALGLAGLILHAGLAGLYSLGARLIGSVPALVAWQQLVALAWLWLKLLRLAWAVQMVAGPTSRA
jgi:hypothetical protein